MIPPSKTKGEKINSEIIIYQTQDGETKIDVRLEDETVWLSEANLLICLSQVNLMLANI